MVGKVSRVRVLIWVLAISPLVITAILYGSLPERIPMQWGLGGTVRYDPKVHIWWVAGMSPALAALFMLLPKIDPRKQNYEKFRGFYDAFCLFIMIFLHGMVGIILSESFFPGRLQVDFVIMAACGVLFVFLGNMLPKVKSNFFMGIRTPWTLSNSEIWNKTHRLAGFLWFFGGLLILALNFFVRDTALFVVFMVIVAVMALVPVVMSYIWYQKLPSKTGDAE